MEERNDSIRESPSGPTTIKVEDDSKDGSIMIKVIRLENTKLTDPEYYRKSESLNAIGFYLKPDDEI